MYLSDCQSFANIVCNVVNFGSNRQTPIARSSATGYTSLKISAMLFLTLGVRSQSAATCPNGTIATASSPSSGKRSRNFLVS